MQSFLAQSIEYLYDKYGEGISDLCVVLPNKRAGLYIKKHYAHVLNKTAFLPDIMAIEDVVELLSGYSIADTTTLIFELYEVVKEVKGKEVEDFEEFSKWGQVLLADINEIDSYLVDSEQLFGNLKEVKELDSWSLNANEGLTEFQKQYLAFWKSLGTYYKLFRKRLEEKKLVYQGLAYHVVAGSAVEKVANQPWKKLVFIGFNALNKSEEKILSSLLAEGKADVIWDSDEYYLNNIQQEAGTFIRKNVSNAAFSKDNDAIHHVVENLLTTDNKQITIIGAAKNIGQTKAVGNIVANLQKQDPDLKNTALVLADENLLFPVLHSLPSKTGNVNITMGYPLANTSLSGFIDALMDLHVSSQKISSGAENYSLYHRQFLTLINHPVMGIIFCDTDKVQLSNLSKIIRKGNISFISDGVLKKLFTQVPAVKSTLSPLLKCWHSVEHALVAIEYVINTVKGGLTTIQQNTSIASSTLEFEYLFAYSKILKRINALIDDYPDSITSIKVFQGIVKQLVKSVSLPFYGEPLTGLQLMGMLETRTLDFENVIIVSCNEKVLPVGKSVNSFIPFELKRHFGLPTYGDRDAIFSYHFYRLLQRAKNINLLYNTENDTLGSGEKSRFITQLMHELPKVNKRIVMKERIANVPISANNKDHNIEIVKNEEVLKALEEKSKTGFSPSLLNVYIKCPLQFYFKVIGKVKEDDEVEDEIGADVLGNVIHKALETLYSPYLNSKLKIEDVSEMQKQVEPLVKELFEREYSTFELTKGKNLLTLKVAQRYLLSFLETEKTYIKTLGRSGNILEINNLEYEISVVSKIGDREVKLKGVVDRVDYSEGCTRIIDYKTGLVAERDLKIKSISDLFEDSSYAKSFQLLMYGWLFWKDGGRVSSLESGIISFRNLSSGLLNVNVAKERRVLEQHIVDFEEGLQSLLAEIFNPSVKFTQTLNAEDCKYCPYVEICNR